MLEFTLNFKRMEKKNRKKTFFFRTSNCNAEQQQKMDVSLYCANIVYIMVQNPLKCKEYCVQLENFITFVFGARVFGI